MHTRVKIVASSGGNPPSNGKEPSASETDTIDVEMNVMPAEVNKTGATSEPPSSEFD